MSTFILQFTYIKAVKQCKKNYTEKYEHIVNVDEHPVNQVLKIAKKTICGLKKKSPFLGFKTGKFCVCEATKIVTETDFVGI